MDMSYKIVATAMMVAMLAGLVGLGAFFLQIFPLVTGVVLLMTACVATALVTIVVDVWIN